MPGPGEHVLGRAKARQREHGLQRPPREYWMGGAWNQPWLSCGRMLLVPLNLCDYSLASLSGRVSRRRIKVRGGVERISFNRENFTKPVQRDDLFAALSGVRLPWGKVRSDWKETKIEFEYTRVFPCLMPI